MKRNEWIYIYEIGTLLEATDKRVKYHSDRLVFWHSELEAVKQDIKNAPTQIHEYQVTGGTRMDVVVDPALMKRMNECQAKIAQHESLLREFQNYHGVFTANDSHTTLDLNMDDVLFFHLGDQPDDE